MQTQFYSRILLIPVIIFVCGSLRAQTSLLNQRVSIEMHNQSLEMALTQISKVGGFAFSYNPNQLPLDKKVNVSLKKITIAQLLDTVLADNSIKYKEVGRHLILKKDRSSANTTYRVASSHPSSETPVSNTFYRLNGNIRDFSTKKPLTDASISFQYSDEAVVSDISGNFSVDLRSSHTLAALQLRHRFYQSIDTTIDLSKGEILSFEMIPIRIDSLSLLPFQLADPSALNPVADVFLVRLLINEKMLNEPEARNFRHRLAQFTFISPAGTNSFKAGSTTNNLSLNLLAGYAAGVEGIEIGGLLNAIRYHVNGVQVSGLGNVVGGKLNGLQLGGVFNINRGSVNGFQIAGVNNWADSLRLGGQVSGVINMLTGTLKGIQVAGVVNGAREVNGLQLAGLMNISATKVNGAQISSIFNFANVVRGVQLGLLNYADSIQGVPIGLLSFVRKNGLKRALLSGSELVPFQLSFKTGTPHFYNIFSFGINPFKGTQSWSYGYGLGSMIYLKKSHALQMELSVHQLNEGIFEGLGPLNLLNQVQLAWSIPLNQKLSLEVGPVANFLLSGRQGSLSLENFSRSWDYFSFQMETNNNRMQFWVGGKAGISLGTAHKVLGRIEN